MTLSVLVLAAETTTSIGSATSYFISHTDANSYWMIDAEDGQVERSYGSKKLWAVLETSADSEAF